VDRVLPDADECCVVLRSWLLPRVEVSLGSTVRALAVEDELVNGTLSIWSAEACISACDVCDVCEREDLERDVCQLDAKLASGV
jgi:hypothetical protein